MTFDQIKTFLWVARLGGFRKAAERLNLSQPAVSTRISNLEHELRVPLFERGPGVLVLTKHGTLLLSYAEQMLFVEEEIKQRVANPSEAEGLFRVGVNLNFFTREIVYGAPSTQWWTELSSAIAGGLVVATVLTLIVTPAMLMLGEKERHLGKPVPLPNE